MKFNFEKAKDVIKKTVIGSAVVTASLAPMKSNAQEIKLDQENIKNKSETPTSLEHYRTEYIKYMEHPSYKERLAKELFGDLIIDEEKQKIIDKEYTDRLEQVKKISMYDMGYIDDPNNPSKYSKIGTSDYIETSFESANHELSHSADQRIGHLQYNGFEKKKIESYARRDMGLEKEVEKLEINKYNALDSIGIDKYKENQKKFIDILKNYIKNNENDTNFCQRNNINVLKNNINELNAPYYSLKTFYKNFNYLDQIAIMKENRELMSILEPYENTRNEYENKIKKINNYLEYLNESTEIKARLNSLRLRAVSEFGFNLNFDFDINDFEKLKDDPQYKQLKNELGLTNEQINELMKYTAMNEKNNNGDTYYHKDWDYSNKEGQA